MDIVDLPPIGSTDPERGKLMALVSTAGKTDDEIADETMNKLDAYFRQHPDEKVPGWDDHETQDDPASALGSNTLSLTGRQETPHIGPEPKPNSTHDALEMTAPEAKRPNSPIVVGAGVTLPASEAVKEAPDQENGYGLEEVTMGQTERDWIRFERDLAETLQGLDEDDFLIISTKLSNRFVQFAAQGRFGMRVEAASNDYITDPRVRLDPDDMALMTRLGWKSPTGSAEQEDTQQLGPDGSPNFFVDEPYPVEFDRLAHRTVQTLRYVYSIDHPGRLQYAAYTQSGQEIRFPGLRIKREGAH